MRILFLDALPETAAVRQLTGSVYGGGDDYARTLHFLACQLGMIPSVMATQAQLIPTETSIVANTERLTTDHVDERPKRALVEFSAVAHAGAVRSHRSQRTHTGAGVDDNLDLRPREARALREPSCKDKGLP